MPAQTEVLRRGVPEAQDAAAKATHREQLPVRRLAEIIAFVVIMGSLVDEMPTGLRADQIAGRRPGASEPVRDADDLKTRAAGQGTKGLLWLKTGDLIRQAPLMQP